MPDGTTTARSASDIPDPAFKLTQTEALLAVLVNHLDEEVSHLRYVLGGVLQDLYGRERCAGADREDWPVYAMQSLYPQRIDPAIRGARESSLPPFPTHWLANMARSGRSLAQVTRSREEAASRLAAALGGASS